MRRRALLLVVTIAIVAAAGAPAFAALDPTHAQADVDDAMAKKAYPFCHAPHEPLSSRAIDLCPHASAIPDCAGFAAACAKAAAAKPPSLPPWWMGWLSLPPFIGLVAQVTVWVVIAALVIAILAPIARGLMRLRRQDEPGAKEDIEPARAPALLELEEAMTLADEEQLLARADQLTARGELQAALQLYLAASLRALDKRGAVRLAKDRTNGEYVRGCSDPSAKPALREIVREVDRVQFGGEDATQDAVGRAAHRAVAIVRALPVAMMLLVIMVCSLGCSGASVPKPRVAGDDPAGDELVRDVLTRQAITVGSLETALSSMPLPHPGERTAAVIVDMDRTVIDDETREHLAAWVEEGGVLVLAGFPPSWLKDYGAGRASSSGPHKLTARRLLARAVAPGSGEENDDEEDATEESAIYSRTEEHGEVISGDGLKLGGPSERIAWFDDGTTYAAVLTRGRGFVLGIVTNELLTNAGLARPGNAALLVAILASTSRTEMRFADADDGVSPPSTPIAAMLRAGLGMGLGHALVFTLVLFLAVGTRLSRPRPAAPPRRRAFAEHVEAVGALYARARSAPHALTAYARFADERLRARMPRGSSDIAAFLASRARMPLDACQRLWARAMQAKAGAPPIGDELAVLRELGAVYAAAMAQDR